MQQHTINKSIILDFYRRAIAQGDIAFAERILADDYVQHSPGLKPGKAGVLEAIQQMQQLPKPPATNKPFMRLIAEGEYVVTNLCFDWGGQQKVVVDLFRFENGLLAEHWDAIQDVPPATLNGHAVMDGPWPMDNPDLTAPNKAIVAEFYQQIVVERRLDRIDNYVSPDLIQHRPDLANGRHGLFTYLRQGPSISRICRLIAEGDFVVVQAEGRVNEKPALLYEIFRLHQHLIVEQWGLSRTDD